MLTFTKILLLCFLCLFPVSTQSKETIHSEDNGSNWNIYRTNGHQKAQGLTISFSYPKSWRGKESDMEHVVQSIVGPADSVSMLNIILTVTEMPSDLRNLSLEEITNTLVNKPEVIKKICDKKADFIGGAYVSVGKYPGYWAQYATVMPLPTDSALLYSHTVAVFCGKQAVSIQCLIGGSIKDDRPIKTKFDDLLPLFQNIVKTLQINDTQEDSFETANATEIGGNTFSSENISLPEQIAFAISIVLVLLLRIPIIRRPVRIWLAILMSLLIYLAVFVTIDLTMNCGGNIGRYFPLSIVVSYFIFRKGAKKYFSHKI